MSSIQRAITAEELAHLRTYSKSSLQIEIIKAVFFGLLFLSAVIFAVLFSLWKWLGPKFGYLDAEYHAFEFMILSFALVSTFFGGQFLRDRSSTKTKASIKQQEFYKHVAADISNQLVLLTTCTVMEAYEVQENEDEGVGFLLVLEDERVLCVIGQDLYEHAHDAEDEDGSSNRNQSFPSSRIELVTAPLSSIRLGLRGTGDPLPIKAVMAQNTRKKLKDHLEDGKIYDQSLAQLLEKYYLKPL